MKRSTSGIGLVSNTDLAVAMQSIFGERSRPVLCRNLILSREATKEISQPQGGWFIVILDLVLKGHRKEELLPASLQDATFFCVNSSHFVAG